MQIQNAGVVVTGAGRGIGRALAGAFAARGARVVVNDLDEVACRRVAQEIGALPLPGDAASAAGAERLVGDASAHLGAIDLFCANAGVAAEEPGTTGADEVWQVSWEVNVMAHVRAFRALAPAWLARGEGRFLATVSAAGLLMMPGAPAYTATKHAALAHAEWLSATYGHRGITVQALCPQGVRTDMARTDTPEGAVMLAPTLIETDDVLPAVFEALDDDRFLILPHPEVAGYERARAGDRDRWLAGMRGIQQEIDRRRSADAGS